MVLHAGEVLRGTRAPAPIRSRLPSGQLRQPGRAYADDPRPTMAERLATPLDFTTYPDGSPRRDLPCTQPDADPEAWFPVGSTGWQHEAQMAYAKALCDPCPVRVACRDYATIHCLQGIWGATDDDDRRALRRGSA